MFRGHMILSRWQDVLDRFWRVQATSKSVLDVLGLYLIAFVKPSSTITHMVVECLTYYATIKTGLSQNITSMFSEPIASIYGIFTVSTFTVKNQPHVGI